MPWKRSCASRVCSLSRIIICRIEGKEVAGHLLENKRLQAPKIEHPELQGLFDGHEEGTSGVGAFHLEQTTQLAHAVPVGALLECSSIALEVRMMAAQELLFKGRAAAHPCWGGMMPGQSLARITLPDQPRVPGNL